MNFSFFYQHIIENLTFIVFATLHIMEPTDRAECKTNRATHVSLPTRNGCCFVFVFFKKMAANSVLCFLLFPTVIVVNCRSSCRRRRRWRGETIVALLSNCIICYFNYNSITLAGQSISNWDRCLAGYYYRPAIQRKF